jgi:hypothetical protein
MKINIGKYKKNGNPRTEKIHIDPWDTWSMDYTLALIILPMLNQLKESKHGAPSSMPSFGMQSNTHRQLCLGFYKDGDDLADKAGFEQWDEILDKMIWSFEEIIRDDPPEFWITKPIWHDNWEDNWVEIDSDDFSRLPDEIIDNDDSDNKYQLVLKRSGELDHKALEEYNNKVQDGLSLFGKHFRNLWD